MHQLILREQDKHFLISLYAAIAVVFTWKGAWGGIYLLPYISEPFVFLFLGFAILTFSGLIFREFDPLGGIENAVNKTLHTVSNHPKKELFQIKYYDKVQKKNITISAKWIQKIEKDALIVVPPHQKQELFIPMHRVTEVLYKGKQYWRL